MNESMNYNSVCNIDKLVILAANEPNNKRSVEMSGVQPESLKQDWLNTVVRLEVRGDDFRYHIIVCYRI